MVLYTPTFHINWDGKTYLPADGEVDIPDDLARALGLLPPLLPCTVGTFPFNIFWRGVPYISEPDQCYPLDLATILGLLASGNDWYVSSLSGSDANTGRAAGAAFATIAALLADPDFDSGARVILESGSTWREFFDGQLLDNITVEASDPAGTKPVLDGSDIATNGDFSLAGGQTNTYEIAWVPDFGNGVDTHRLTVYEDGELLIYRATVADVEANAGSYTVDKPADTTGNVVHVHPKGSTNPTADGKVYEITRRNMALWLGNDATVSNVVTQKAIRDSGSCRAGRDADFSDCEFRYGTKHNFYMNSGIATRCKFLYNDALNNHGGTDVSGFTLGVVYQADATGLSGRFVDCEFEGGNPANTTIADKTTGLYAHSSTQKANVHTLIELTGCTITKCSKGLDADALTMRAVDCTMDQAVNIGVGTLTGEYIDCNLGIEGTVANISIAGSGNVISFVGCGFVINNPSGALYRTLLNDVDVTFEYCSFWRSSFSGNPAIVALTDDSDLSSLTFNHNICSVGKYVFNIGGSGSTAIGSISSDENIARRTTNIAARWNYLATDYNNLAEWQPVLNQDANSVEENITFADPANFDFTTTGATATTAATLTAGVEYAP